LIGYFVLVRLNRLVSGDMAGAGPRWCFYSVSNWQFVLLPSGLGSVQLL